MLVSRSRLSAVERERDEWRRRAETVPRPRTRYVTLRSPYWVRLVAAAWFVTIGLLVGGAAIPHADDTPTLREDYPACIAAARGEYPLESNRYQELVRALYACGVYDVPGLES
jgi:hypothetical protein